MLRIDWPRELLHEYGPKVLQALGVLFIVLAIGFAYSTWQECLHCADGCRDYGIAPEMTACTWPWRCVWHVHGDRWPAHGAWWPKDVFMDIVGEGP